MIIKVLIFNLFWNAVMTALDTCIYPCINCEQETKLCNKCDLGFYITNQRQCKPCIGNCKVCTNSNNCLVCPLGTNYYKNNCLRCQFGCLSCTHIQNITTGQLYAPCSLCFVGYYQNQQSKCIACLPACNKCSNGSSCQQCADKMGYDSQNNQCVTCTSNCTTCNGKKCIQCQKGFYLSHSGKNCIKCSQNCIQCNNNGCQKCVTKFFVNNASDCERCSQQCNTCQSSTVCLVCNTGKYLTEHNTCQACMDFCVYCNQSQVCDTCQYGYYYDNNECNFCGQACSICSSQANCSKCEGSFYLSQGRCEKCSQDCVFCSAKDNCLVCTSLLTVLINGMCVSCIDLGLNCLTCENESICLSCDLGYYLYDHQCLPNNDGLSTLWIILIIFFSILGAIGLGMAIYCFWKNRSGYGILNGQNSGVRASYYQVP